MPGPGLGAERTEFNPGASAAVDRIKRAAATYIDALDAEIGDPRAMAIAVTNAEQSSMWAVKAVTAVDAQ